MAKKKGIFWWFGKRKKNIGIKKLWSFRRENVWIMKKINQFSFMNGHCWFYRVNLIYHHNFARCCHWGKRGESHTSDPSFLKTAWGLHLPQNNKFRLKESIKSALRDKVLFYPKKLPCVVLFHENRNQPSFLLFEFTHFTGGKAKPQRGNFTCPRRQSSRTIEWGFKTELQTKGGSRRAIVYSKRYYPQTHTEHLLCAGKNVAKLC